MITLTKSEREVINDIREVKASGFGSVSVKVKDGKIVHSEKTIGKQHKSSS